MCACCCNFKSALGLHLATYFAQVQRVRRSNCRSGLYSLPAIIFGSILVGSLRIMGNELSDHVQQVARTKDFYGRDKSRLLSAFRRQHQTHALLVALQRQCRGQCAAYGAQSTGQR